MTEDQEDEAVILMVLAYLWEQKQLGRYEVYEKEVCEALGFEWDGGPNRLLVLSDKAENIISLMDYKKTLH